MAVTAHYSIVLNGKLQMRSQLIAFRYVPGSHDGESMATVMLRILDELRISNRVSEHYQSG
jgi:hypothetical protein